MYDPKQKSQEEGPEVRRPYSPLEEPGVMTTPTPQRWWTALDAGTAPFADRDRIQVMLEQLRAFLGERRASVRFSTHTGLVRSLRGELYPAGDPVRAPGDMLEIAVEFLGQHGAALHGSRKEYQWLPESQPTVGPCARLRQADASEIPVYGGSMVFHFDQRGQLDLVANSWYPIAPDEEYLPRFELDWEAARSIALEYVISHFLPGAQSQLESPLQTPPPGKGYLDLDAVPGDDLQGGRVVFPWLDEGEATKRGQYRPAFIVLVSERNASRSWEIAVDAENSWILSALEASVGVVQGCVYKSNYEKKNQPPSTVDLANVDEGDFAAKAPHFAMKGDAYKEPSGCPNTSPIDNNRMRSANVYYHLHHALETFSNEIAKDAWSGAMDVPVKMPGTDGKIDVHMIPGEETGKYKHVEKSLWFGTGQSDPPVEDPAYDCEVMYHEYAHAVFHVVQPDIFKGLPYAFRLALNEGGGFYYGCTLSERSPAPAGQPIMSSQTSPSHWGEVAYSHSTWAGFRELKRENPEEQEANFDWLRVYNVFPRYDQGTEDPAGDTHACGMVWARALWDIRRVLGYQIADAVILRSLALLGGVQSDWETPAEAIIQVDGDYAQITGGPSHESALRLIFCSRGIAADSPVHDLVTITLDGKSYVLAATENTAQGGDQPGCMISGNQGDTWAPLGSGGPAEAVALAALENGIKALIWAASEEWSPAGGGATLTGKIYQYELELDSNVNPVTDDSWSELDDLPEKVNILSLAGMEKPGGDDEFWLFAGTERGLYRYDGSWTLVETMAKDRQVFDLAITLVPANGQPMPRLLVATQSGVYVLDPDSLERDPDLEKSRPTNYALTVAADGTPGHLWAGTAFDGIYHFDPADKRWKEDSTIEDERPVYRLLVEQAGAQQTFYAGTNGGVYRRRGGGDWEAYNDTSHPNGEAIQSTSAMALSRVGNRLLAGTAQRGAWRRNVSDGGGWGRLTEGLPRIGRLADARVPPGTCNWSLPNPFERSLPDNGVGTHVLYIPNDDCNQLSFDTADNVELSLYYVAPYINIDQGYVAGLQIRTLDGDGNMEEPVMGGFYLLAVRATNAVSYQVGVTLS
jgi:hypothetical protein